MGNRMASVVAVLVVSLELAVLVQHACATRPVDGTSSISVEKKDRKKKVHPFSSPVGLFIQERASKQLPGPGQHFQFGALVTWDQIHAKLDADPDAKLLLVVRHGQAISNWLSDTLGPDEWFVVEETCNYTDKNGTTYGVFDADLTDMGEREAQSLNLMLKDADWWTKLTGSKPTRAIVSPLSRCLQTCLLTTSGLPIVEFNVEENVRETLGEDTCDARRSVSDPNPKDPSPLQGPCAFERGLATKFPQFKYPIVGSGAKPAGFGLLTDRDTLWTKDREDQKSQTKRATRFLHDLWTFAPEKVVLVVTHSGFTRSILLAVGREPYRPQNTELVPVLVSKNPSYTADADA
mmetsp:Transcript_32937/g.72765  ORF Transcript_32937/g.72765 Transcript_32937/m.72765 type:complete len:349 (+) Transcript_32937:2382-3428(+)|eukprot:CAMPEP_0202902594 /NCGR_PEP_ID=MMETSP1392-20130828/16942_1 /ASSEMBLY_ACC=CAM_ASM_000868 /TAXON_ID=225041 /ORGANISM="Chlamydomonas chlamydogama, Strain SAG 11-48b" /LENGTH=348 /DNA_ID=CAMNT_0049589383 /DNA_START=2348 /DNA_END=3394 /DNA_ORIENTATION=-